MISFRTSRARLTSPARAALGLLGLFVLLGLCSTVSAEVNPGWGKWWLPPDRSAHGHGIDGLFYWIFWITTIIFIACEVVLVVFLIKYRSRPDRKKAHFTHGNPKLEMAWTIAPAIILAFLALLGLDIMAYRKQFHELNSLISLLSMLQSNKDVLGLADPGKRAENLLYLGLVSDLLGVISMISSYYTQENSSLLFNNLSEVIHQRCDGLKINIQLKVLHATVEFPQQVLAQHE